MSCDKLHLSQNPICQLQAVSIITSRTFFIGSHTCHRRVYLLWLTFICTVFWCPIYFLRSIRTSFRIFHVPVNFLIRSVRFQKILNKMILWSTSEALIWILTVIFITLIIRFPWIKAWFLLDFLLSLLFKAFLSWIWASTVIAHWLRKCCSPNSNNQFVSQI